jgi:hypothetical protein
MLTENAQHIVKQLLDRFQSGDIAPLIQIATLKLTSETSIPASRWSICNQLLAYIQTGEIDCRGFRQWEQIHRHVIKGSHAAYILGPIQIKERTEETETLKLVGFKSIPVFSASMTEGEPIPAPVDLAPTSLPPLYEVAQAWGIQVDYIPFGGSAFGSFQNLTKTIRLATHEEKVFFHELAHSAHARLETLKGGQDPRQETIAEFVACVLMQVYGLRDTTGYTWEYVKSYNPENPIKAIMEALDTIDKVLNQILETANQFQPI